MRNIAVMRSLVLLAMLISSIFIVACVRPLPTHAGVGLFPAPKQNLSGEKFGYIDKLGRWVIDARFDDAHGFVDGYARIQENGLWGYIDWTGNIAISPIYADLPSNFSEGFARVRVGLRRRYIDTSGAPAFDTEFSAAKPFRNGHAFVRQINSQKWSIIDTNGLLVVTNSYDGCGLSFSDNGLAPVLVGELWGFINHTGDFIIQPQFNSASEFSEGLACVRSHSNRKCGFIDESGIFVINPRFDESQSFSEGLAAVRSDGLWGFIDKKGHFAVKPMFMQDPMIATVVYPYTDGLACVVVDGSYGYIDGAGNMVLEPEFSLASPFRGGLAMVFKKTEGGQVVCYITTKGEEIWCESTNPNPK